MADVAECERRLSPVAWPAHRGYAAVVSRPHLHRWAVIFLLVSKLIIGQLAHAMPHMAMPAAMDEIAALAGDDMTGHDSPPCGDHQQASSTDEPAEKSCCENGGCACPCLHSPAATTAVPFPMHRANADQIAIPVEGAAWQRVSALFRPPA